MQQFDSVGRAIFNRLRVLVVEDQFLVADELTETLRDWGCEVFGPAINVAAALEIIETHTLDAAILDINLGNELSFPIAAVLEQRDVPFIFLTGYPRDGVFPSAHAAVPRLKKPERLREALADFARAR
jgi:DNA-binding response OmpR family regulator